MDRDALIKKLHSSFCELDKGKYPEAWLSAVDFGRLYQPEKYTLNVKVSHQIESSYDEIKAILELLDKQAHDELQYIWSVSVYDAKEDIHCAVDEFLVFDKSMVC